MEELLLNRFSKLFVSITIDLERFMHMFKVKEHGQNYLCLQALGSRVIEDGLN